VYLKRESHKIFITVKTNVILKFIDVSWCKMAAAHKERKTGRKK
jgi:hypothetical protein